MKGDIDLARAAMMCAAVGLAAGVVSSIPVLRWPNICCLWIVAGGFFSAYLSTRGAKAIEIVDGAVLGGVFGLFYGVVVNVATFAVNMVLNLLGLGNVVRGVAGTGLLDKMGVHLGVGLLAGLFLIIMNFILGIVFGAVGGVIFAAAFEEGVAPGGRQQKSMFTGPKGPTRKSRLTEM
jgi:hypothetical protein